MGRYGEMVYGAKYVETSKLSTVEIAKCFRADVKEAIKTGALPRGLKLSVKSDYFSGGSSIHVKIVAVPQGFGILNPERVIQEKIDPHAPLNRYQFPRFTPAAEALQKKLETMLFAFNLDGSDSSVDYFHVRFYQSVDFDWNLIQMDEDRIVRENAELISHAL